MMIDKETEMAQMIEYNGRFYNARHGGPFDRGSADSWYDRDLTPHYFTGASYDSTKIEEVDMSQKELSDYMAGYQYNKQFGGKKEW